MTHIEPKSTFEIIIQLKNLRDTYAFARRDLIDAIAILRADNAAIVLKQYRIDELFDEVNVEISILFEQYGQEVFDENTPNQGSNS